MRIDVVSIFPQYLAPLELSLLGRAHAGGLLDLRTHDLRDWTHDRHRTVDDSPYGGGPGMVMRPEPWGEAIDALLARGHPGDDQPTLIVPTPAGTPFRQPLAEQLAARPWLIVACGRYEGIDHRVTEHFSARLDVIELSIGDYVLNGGEAAALVVIEAVARLLPGFVGNPASLVEESHTGEAVRELEYPVYTRPGTWRGLDVPSILLSGDHGRIESWRRDQSVRRTAERRPDLAHPAQLLMVPGIAEPADIRLATPADAGELWTLQRACYAGQAYAGEAAGGGLVNESFKDLRHGMAAWLTFVVRAGGRLVASARCRGGNDGSWRMERLLVAPDLAGRGIDRWLLRHVEATAPAGTTSYRLCTDAASERELRFYRQLGYRRSGGSAHEPGTVVLVKMPDEAASRGAANATVTDEADD
jgi:tRNA (guanine37-N1)-methyltransferase